MTDIDSVIARLEAAQALVTQFEAAVLRMERNKAPTHDRFAYDTLKRSISEALAAGVEAEAQVTALQSQLEAEREVSDADVELAAQAIFETWALHEDSEMKWSDAVAASRAPDAYPKMARIVPLCRAEARAAAAAIRSRSLPQKEGE